MERGCNVIVCALCELSICMHVAARGTSTIMCVYVWLLMSVKVSVFVHVSEFGHWVCGESWHATKDLQPTAPVPKAGHPVSYSFVVCLFVLWDGGFLGFFLLLSFCLLVCYTHTCIIFPCISDCCTV